MVLVNFRINGHNINNASNTFQLDVKPEWDGKVLRNHLKTELFKAGIIRFSEKICDLYLEDSELQIEDLKLLSSFHLTEATIIVAYVKDSGGLK